MRGKVLCKLDFALKSAPKKYLKERSKVNDRVIVPFHGLTGSRQYPNLLAHSAD